MPAHELFGTLARLLDRDKSFSGSHAIAVLDVDGLTEINLVYGRVAGDFVLALMSDGLAQTLEAAERAAWWAGDQCVVLFPGVTRRKALRRTRQIVADIADYASRDVLTVNVSAGVAASPVDARTNSGLVQVAATALHRAKRDRRRRVRTPGRRSRRAISCFELGSDP